MRDTGKWGMAVLAVCWFSGPVAAITIEFDYTYDSPAPFFSTQTKRNILEAAGNFFENILTDDLNAIQPDGRNTWSVETTHPNTGQPLVIDNPIVPADTLVIFVGGRDLPDTNLAQSGDWRGMVEGNEDWVKTVIERGEPLGRGRGATDFGPWGDVMSFDTTSSDGTPRPWHDAIGSPPPTDELDLLSATLRELGQILGLGRSDAWKTWVDEAASQFTGPTSQSLFGGPIDLEPSDSDPYLYWQAGTTGTLTIDNSRGQALNTPDQPVGDRRLPTYLDVAALQDIGWEISDSIRFFAPGDSNEDTAFDQRDIVLVMQTAKYRTEQTATWSEGDWNRDGVFNQHDIAAALAAGAYTGASFSANSLAGEPVALPEPTTLALLCIGLLSLSTRRLHHEGRFA